MKSKTKFKVGDKVRILPSAIGDGVSYKAHNYIGHITKLRDISCEVSMDNRKLNNGSYPWAVSLRNITPIMEVGHQQLFSFMEEI